MKFIRKNGRIIPIKDKIKSFSKNTSSKIVKASGPIGVSIGALYIGWGYRKEILENLKSKLEDSLI